jgi:hypothetical protein
MASSVLSRECVRSADGRARDGARRDMRRYDIDGFLLGGHQAANG